MIFLQVKMLMAEYWVAKISFVFFYKMLKLNFLATQYYWGGLLELVSHAKSQTSSATRIRNSRVLLSSLCFKKPSSNSDECSSLSTRANVQNTHDLGQRSDGYTSCYVVVV